MSKDILEKGAIIQRDKETFAIAPHIAGGIIDPAGLRKIADVAEKYHAKVLKITSAQRIAIVGIDPKDIDDAWKDMSPEQPSACASAASRSVQALRSASAASRTPSESA
jgi:NAD(P)H-nitrite reductase large subunit